MVALEVISEKRWRASSTNSSISRMSDFSHTNTGADDLMDCDDLFEDKDVTSLSAMVDGSLSSPSQSQDRPVVVLQVEVKNVDPHESSSQEEMETGEDQLTSLETEPSVCAAASSETRNYPESVSDDNKKEETPAGSESKRKLTGRFFRWLRRNRIQPAPQKPTAEDHCQADSEGPGELPGKKLTREEEKKEEDSSAEGTIQHPPSWIQLVCGSESRRRRPKGPNQDQLKKAV